MAATGWKNPAHFKRCDGKRGYSSLRKAELQAERASARSEDLIIAYTCLDCGYFHIGHADLSQQIIRVPLALRPCQHCGEPIPEAKILKAKRFHWTALYCSDQCQKKAQRKRKSIRKRQREETID
jgi:hypothetical protein